MRQMRLPTAVEPVNAMQVDVGIVDERLADLVAGAGDDVHHAGRQDLEGRRASSSVASGVCSVGLMTTVLPAASAGATFHAMSSSG